MIYNQLRFRAILLKLILNLSEDEKERLLFICNDDIPYGIRNDSSSLSMLEILFQENKINEKTFDYLIDKFRTIQCFHAVQTLENYKKQIESYEYPSESLEDFSKVMPDLFEEKIAEKKSFIRRKYLAYSIISMIIILTGCLIFILLPKIKLAETIEENSNSNLLEFQFSRYSPIANWSCVRMCKENYLCVNRDIDLTSWFNAKCIAENESANSLCNYGLVCLLKQSKIDLSWSFRGPIEGTKCIRFKLLNGNSTSKDNYICWKEQTFSNLD